MASKARRRQTASRPGSRQPSSARGAQPPSGWRASVGVLLAFLIVIVAVVFGTELVFNVLGGSGSAPSASPTASPATSPSPAAAVTNVSADQLAEMLKHKDFTLLNVKTPYIGEIEGTDLYIPYDQLKARASQLPASKGAKILVYCRSGVQSAQAAQTLLGLGYTNVWNLDGGMNAWQASGRPLVNLNRQ